MKIANLKVSSSKRSTKHSASQFFFLQRTNLFVFSLAEAMEIPWAETCLPFLLAAAIWTAVFFSAAGKANDPTGHPWAAKAIVGLGRAVAVFVTLAAAAADCRSHDAGF